MLMLVMSLLNNSVAKEAVLVIVLLRFAAPKQAMLIITLLKTGTPKQATFVIILQLAGKMSSVGHNFAELFRQQTKQYWSSLC